MKKRPLVEVEWIDSAMSYGWKAAGGVTRCRTAGYLLKRGKKVIRIAMNQQDETRQHYGAVGEVMAIPMSCVKRVRRLK